MNILYSCYSLEGTRVDKPVAVSEGDFSQVRAMLIADHRKKYESDNMTFIGSKVTFDVPVITT